MTNELSRPNFRLVCTPGPVAHGLHRTCFLTRRGGSVMLWSADRQPMGIAETFAPQAGADAAGAPRVAALLAFHMEDAPTAEIAATWAAELIPGWTFEPLELLELPPGESMGRAAENEDAADRFAAHLLAVEEGADLAHYAAHGAATVLVENWRAAIRDGADLSSLLGDVDDTKAALDAFRASLAAR